MLHTAQIRAARALLGWRQDDLSKKSGIGLATVQRIEKGSGTASGNYLTVLKLQSALEKAGIHFIEADESGGIGLRLHHLSAPRRKR